MTPLIEFRGATVKRGSRVALDALDLSLYEGEHTAILGPNGCGKSTLIKALTRECYPLAGSSGPPVRILGADTWDVFELRSLLGVVSNDLMATCTRDFKGLEIVLSGFFSSIGIWPHHKVTEAMRQKAQEVLELLEAPHLGDRWLDEMSSGEARRILVGRALVHDPKALVFDEPSTSLDLRAAAELRDIMRKLAGSGVTIVLATHHLPEIIPEVSRIVLLRGGRVFCDGPKEKVLTADTLSELYQMNVELLERDGYYHLL